MKIDKETEIKNASPAQVAEALSEYNKWRRGLPPYEGPNTLTLSAHELGLYLDRAIHLLKGGKK